MKTLLHILLFTMSLEWTWVGCNSNLLVLSEGESIDLQVIELSSYTAVTGDIIQVTGLKLPSDLKLFVDDIATDLNIIDSRHATFVFEKSSKKRLRSALFIKKGP